MTMSDRQTIHMKAGHQQTTVLDVEYNPNCLTALRSLLKLYSLEDYRKSDMLIVRLFLFNGKPSSNNECCRRSASRQCIVRHQSSGPRCTADPDCVTLWYAGLSPRVWRNRTVACGSIWRTVLFIVRRNKKLRYREEHSASFVVYFMSFLWRKSVDGQSTTFK